MANILEKTNGQVTARGGLSLNDIVYIIRNVSGLTGEDAITTLNNLKLLFTIEPYAALIFGATVTWDALTGLNKTLEATGDFTLDITNVENGMSGDLSLTVTNPTTITLPAGSNVSGSFTAIESGDYLVKWDYDGTQFYFSIESGASSTTPAGATGDIQLNDGAGGLGVAAVGVGKYEGNGAWTFGGNSNSASGYYSAVAGGRNNTASGSCSVSLGYNAIARTVTEVAHGGKQNSERRMNVLAIDTVNGNATLLNLFDSTFFVLPAQISGWAFKIKVVGVKDDGSSAAFFFEGCIQRKSDASVNFVGTPLKTSYMDDGALTGVDAEVIANNTNKRLDIQVTGRAATNIRWTAVVDVAQSVWGAW